MEPLICTLVCANFFSLCDQLAKYHLLPLFSYAAHRGIELEAPGARVELMAKQIDREQTLEVAAAAAGNGNAHQRPSYRSYAEKRAGHFRLVLLDHLDLLMAAGRPQAARELEQRERWPKWS